MRFNILDDKSELTVEIIGKECSAELKANLAKVLNSNEIYVDVLKFNDKSLNFKIDGIVLNLYYSKDGNPPFIWRNVSIIYELVGGIPLHRIKIFTDCVKINRRNAFRLSLGKQVTAQLGLNNKTADVILKDLSASGFSIVLPDDLEKTGIVSITYSETGSNLRLQGRIVRKQKISDVKYVYGCKFDCHSNNIEQFIAKKQSEMLQNKRMIQRR